MLADRPKHNPGHQLVQSMRQNKEIIYFVPDCLEFGIWKVGGEACQAFPVWLSRFQGKNPQWRSYCDGRGWQSVEW